MSQSAGVFTFPSTGVWHVRANMGVYQVSGYTTNYAGHLLMVTLNNSTFAAAAGAWATFASPGDNGSTSSEILINVTDTSLIKVGMNWDCSEFMNVYGNTSVNYTTMAFTKVGG